MVSDFDAFLSNLASLIEKPPDTTSRAFGCSAPMSRPPLTPNSWGFGGLCVDVGPGSWRFGVGPGSWRFGASDAPSSEAALDPASKAASEAPSEAVESPPALQFAPESSSLIASSSSTAASSPPFSKDDVSSAVLLAGLDEYSVGDAKTETTWRSSMETSGDWHQSSLRCHRPSHRERLGRSHGQKGKRGKGEKGKKHSESRRKQARRPPSATQKATTIIGPP
mmetsp:Transcript_14743/g.52500  ORF Transcript_14743/g.52500 Transcript_14743/m.52500 type:complete len:223 (-) Transcript_14743:44-712(-)